MERQPKPRIEITELRDEMTPDEITVLDHAFDALTNAYSRFHEQPIAGDDRMAIAEQAVARLIIESRPVAVPLNNHQAQALACERAEIYRELCQRSGQNAIRDLPELAPLWDEYTAIGRTLNEIGFNYDLDEIVPALARS